MATNKELEEAYRKLGYATYQAVSNMITSLVHHMEVMGSSKERIGVEVMALVSTTLGGSSYFIAKMMGHPDKYIEVIDEMVEIAKEIVEEKRKAEAH